MALLKNEQQVAATIARVEELQALDGEVNAAEWAGIRGFIENLEEQVEAFRSLVGASSISIRDLDGLADLPIRARIAKGLTQQDLAELLGVSQQQVQKDEASEYENVSMSK